jgi:copper chaperone
MVILIILFALKEEIGMADITLSLDGLSCQHCVGRVKQAIDAVSGVQSAAVEIKKASVSFDETVTSKEKIAAAIVDAGYKVVE